ncbi:4'-phosphopantetheinyl transferase family protein [Paenarthrobacter sp. NPDC089989]|uniref:4'-phosphopantetheinyl transferase family protein n=1 Tax=unclassified Paenarthrobacter TaxID=2634190 RepID=UPI0038109697
MEPVLRLLQLGEVALPDTPRAMVLGRAGERRAARFASAQDRDGFIAGRIALRLFAAELLAVDSSRLTPHFDCPQCGPGQDHGRPGFMLDGGPAPLVLSASRASGWVLLAGVVHPAEGLRLGVDLEAVSRVGFAGFDGVALTAGERRLIDAAPEEERDTQRARLWARKEAWLKMTGEGLRRSPAEVDVLDRPGVQDVDTIGGRALPEGLVAALCLDYRGEGSGGSAAS